MNTWRAAVCGRQSLRDTATLVARSSFDNVTKRQNVYDFTRCFVPDFDGAFLSSDSKDALWDRFYTGARSPPIGFDSALLAYFKLLRIAAQACGTPESTALLPGITAQPPFFDTGSLFP